MANWTATRPLVESPPTSINWSLRGRAIASAGTAASPWRWQGDLDLAPGAPPLYAVGARLYAPSAGAFTQVDSVAGTARDPLSLNPFLYAEDSPSTLVDPTGHYASAQRTGGPRRRHRAHRIARFWAAPGAIWCPRRTLRGNAGP